MGGVKANARIRMQNARVRQPAVQDRAVSLPLHAALATSPQHLPPHKLETMPKSAQGRTVARHRVVEVVTVEDLSEPSADLRNRFVHPALQRLLDLLQF